MEITFVCLFPERWIYTRREHIGSEYFQCSINATMECAFVTAASTSAAGVEELHLPYTCGREVEERKGWAEIPHQVKTLFLKEMCHSGHSYQFVS